VKTGLRPITDYTAVRPQSTIKSYVNKSFDLPILQPANIQAIIGLHREQLSELTMLRLDSQASQARRTAGHKIHTLKRNTANCWNVPYFSSKTSEPRRSPMANTATTPSNGTGSQKPDRQTTQHNRH